ncbi:MAG: imidazoleglycerol-phosphate dehydratase HisB [Oscillospiraceae bacterium]|nr:imidazoleglycerol-phosphate dehydratase HisB [Oscillospiraceae bacterium]
MRTAEIIRNTAETKIRLKLTLEGTGAGNIQTGCGFLDHMLTLFAKHGRFDLDISCEGDTWVDDHHTVEDVGIALGQAFEKALGEKRGINRYGSQILPMDETLVLCAVDMSGRAYLGYELPIPSQKIGTFDTELVEEFWLGFVRNAQATLHIRLLTGSNSHHIAEGAFKAAGRALRAAVAVDPACSDEIPSTKGVL